MARLITGAGLPYHNTHLSIIVMSCQTLTLGSPHCCGLPYHGVHLSSSPCSVERPFWATHVVVGCLPQSSPPFVVVGLRTLVTEPRCWVFPWWGSALDLMGLPTPGLGVSCGGGPPLLLRGVLTAVC